MKLSPVRTVGLSHAKKGCKADINSVLWSAMEQAVKYGCEFFIEETPHSFVIKNDAPNKSEYWMVQPDRMAFYVEQN